MARCVACVDCQCGLSSPGFPSPLALDFHGRWGHHPLILPQLGQLQRSGPGPERSVSPQSSRSSNAGCGCAGADTVNDGAGLGTGERGSWEGQNGATATQVIRFRRFSHPLPFPHVHRGSSPRCPSRGVGGSGRRVTPHRTIQRRFHGNPGRLYTLACLTD